MDNVVRKYSLYLWPKSQKDSPLFAGFQPLPGLHPGNYVLTTDATNSHYTLTTNEGKVVVEKGVTGRLGRTQSRVRMEARRRTRSARRATLRSPSSARATSRSGLISQGGRHAAAEQPVHQAHARGHQSAANGDDSQRDHARVREHRG